MKAQAWLVPTLLALSVPIIGHAQSITPRDSLLDQVEDEETVRLPVFGVSSDRVDGYRAVDTSTARIRKELIDTPFTINVITSEFMDDIGAASVNDAMGYLSGVSQSPQSGLSGVADQIMIRGFMAWSRTIDGFSGGGLDVSFDPALIERAEVLKGSNEFLAPQGEPGGGYNLVTKSPQFAPLSTRITVEMADQYYGGRGVIDATGYVPGTEKFAWRIISTYRDAKSHVPGRIIQKTLSPMLSWRPSSKTELKIKGHLVNRRDTGRQSRSHNTLLLREDVSNKVVTMDDILPGSELDPYANVDWAFRIAKPRLVYADFTTSFTDQLHLRLGAIYRYRYDNRLVGDAWINADYGRGSRYNPETGLRTDQQWNLQDGSLPYDPVTNPYIPTPYAPVLNYVENYEAHRFNWEQGMHYHADLFGGFKFGKWRGGELGAFNAATGLSYESNISHNYGYSYWDKDKVNPAVFPTFDSRFGYVPVRPNQANSWWIYDQEGKTRKSHKMRQYYINTQLDLLSSKLQFNAGISRRERVDRGYLDLKNNNEFAGSTIAKSVPVFAILYKVMPWASVYVSKSKNADPASYWDGSRTVRHWSEGINEEIGAKVEFFNRRLQVSGSYFETFKNNIALGHEDNWMLPDGADRYPDYLVSQQSHGIEVDVSGAITSSLSVMGSATHMKRRDELGRPSWGSPDHAYNLYTKYSFRKGSLEGLSLNFGANYRSKAVGNTEGQRTGIGVVIQPAYWFPARTIYSLGAAYKIKDVRFQLNVDNLFDWEGITRGVVQRVGVEPGRNIRLTTTYEF